jgi:hypothetical protein
VKKDEELIHTNAPVAGKDQIDGRESAEIEGVELEQISGGVPGHPPPGA